MTEHVSGEREGILASEALAYWRLAALAAGLACDWRGNDSSSRPPVAQVQSHDP